jgi:hypothetical protein
MKWSKLKSLVENKFAQSLKGRVSINSTAYGNCSCGHLWITIDKNVIANFCTRAFWNRVSGNYYRKNDRWKSDNPIPSYVTKSQRESYGEVEYGELSRQDAYLSCWEYIHKLDHKTALASDDPLIQSLAVLDKRLGKRRLGILDLKNLHPLAKKLYLFRVEQEGKINLHDMTFEKDDVGN